jgi:uncharacterized membrane protein SpoIIM required for sporulation/ABC-type transport system involved in multi-copper enzyme maturation permease subunit
MGSISRVYTIVKREVRDQFRDWRITLPIAFLTAVFPFLIGYVSSQVVQFVQTFDATIIAESLIPFFLLVVGFFPVTISLVIASESFVGEKERRSIEPLLSSPLEDGELYLGKLIAVMVPPLFGSFIGMTVYLVSVFREFGFMPNVPLTALVISLTVAQAFVMVSAAVVISAYATTVRAANLLSSFIVVPMAFLIQWEAIVMFWGDYNDLWWIVIGLYVIAVLFTRVGVSHFNREELLGQEFDTLNIRWLLSVFKDTFIGRARGVIEWYRLQIPPAVRRLRTSLVVMSGLLLGAWWIGFQLADIFRLPPEFVDLNAAGFGVSQQAGLISLISSEMVLVLWFHNLRAMIIGSVLGMLTFGILGVLVLLLPFVVISYLMVPFLSVGVPAWKFLLVMVVPHGIFEIPAILLLGASILQIGVGLATPSKGESIGDGVVRSIGEWAKIMIGLVIPLLLAAACMESQVTPRLALLLLGQ